MPRLWNDNQCGTGGIQNLNKRQRGRKSCHEAKIKRDRDAKKMKDGSLSFLKPKAIPVPSTVRDAGPAMIRASDHIHPTLASMASRRPSLSLSRVGAENGLLAPSLGIQKTGSGFIKRFEEIVKCLPQNIPIGSGNDRLAAFNIEPALLDDPKIDPDDLWEVGFLKEHLGWGEEVDMDELICRGEQGMEGVLRFSKCFIEKRGVSVEFVRRKALAPSTCS